MLHGGTLFERNRETERERQRQRERDRERVREREKEIGREGIKCLHDATLQIVVG